MAGHIDRNKPGTGYRTQRVLLIGFARSGHWVVDWDHNSEPTHSKYGDLRFVYRVQICSADSFAYRGRAGIINQ